MQLTINETNRRREKQMAYNIANGITPTQAIKTGGSRLVAREPQKVNYYVEPQNMVADPVIQYMSLPQLEKAIEHTKQLMNEASRKLDFVEAALHRDALYKLQEMLKSHPKDKD
jgi:excinuclease ABC subunit B